jgi:hypothetical protein
MLNSAPAASDAESDNKVNANLLLAMQLDIDVNTPLAQKMLSNPRADLDAVNLELSAISNPRSVEDGKALILTLKPDLILTLNPNPNP